MNELSKEDLINFLHIVDNDFNPPLSKKVEITEYADKIIGNSELIMYKIKDEIAGIVVLYCNNHCSRLAYIPLVAVHPNYRGIGIAKSIMKSAIKRAKDANMDRIGIHTNNQVALKLYLSLGFVNIIPAERSYLEYNINK